MRFIEYGRVNNEVIMADTRTASDEVSFMRLKEYAEKIQVSPHTIYRNPAKFHMFKVGGSWRANKESIEKFSHTNNNVFRLAVVGSKESERCRSSRGVKNTGLISPRLTERELDALLAPSEAAHAK